MSTHETSPEDLAAAEAEKERTAAAAAAAELAAKQAAEHAAELEAAAAKSLVRVRCTLRNAGSEINGVAFTPESHTNSMVSEPITAEQAGMFNGIPGYSTVLAE